MTTPYTREEINDMDDNLLLNLIKSNSPRLYPHCLIGQPLEEARKKFTEFAKSKIEILVTDKDTCCMDFNTTYFYCKVDENDIITEIWNVFAQ